MQLIQESLNMQISILILNSSIRFIVKSIKRYVPRYESLSAQAKTKRRMSIWTILSSIFLIAALAWATVSFVLVQGNMVRIYSPHEEYSSIEPWPYNIQWAGGRANWFDNVNYTDIQLDQPLPDELLNNLETVLFIVDPAEPPQLWRSSSYDDYDGSGWHKTITGSQTPLGTISRSEAISQGNTIYTVYMNVTGGATTGEIQLPTLFPDIQIIEGSFRSYPSSLLVDYTLETDEYGSAIFKPLIEGSATDNVLISYDVTYVNQDLDAIKANALPGDQAPLSIQQTWASLDGVTLTQAVLDDIAQFENVGSTAYETAMAVDLYFKSNFELIMDTQDRPAEGQEVTDWFLQRGGGLPQDFATAYCVYMRQLGIPARLVTGYALGDSESGQRIIRIRHMMFWVEVYIPLSTGGGEWIQVVPMGLPPSMGGGETPENQNIGNVTLLVGPPTWALVGNQFTLTAAIFVEGLPVVTPENITFFDLTDSTMMGTVAIDPAGTPIPNATITYAFPLNASVGIHIISATWQSPAGTVINYTTVNAVAQANPYNTHTISMDDQIDAVYSDFVLAQTFDVNLANGWDNYTAYWTDNLRIHGTMTVGGQPVNGNDLTNKWVQIMWDDAFIGNATIQSDGTYELVYYLDPMSPLVTTGLHEVWASYAGEYDENGLPVILPGRSSDNSTVDVWGTVGFNLVVNPTDLFAGSSLEYSGTAYLLNGTPLSTGETINFVIGNTIVDTTLTDATGSFNDTYVIPVDTANGTYYVYVNWTSTMDHISSNSSSTIEIIIRSGSTQLSITSDPIAPSIVHLNETMSVSGYLTIQANGSGLAGKIINLYWDNGITTSVLGSNTTDSTGYYVIYFQVPDDYEGDVTYWTEFGPGDPIWQPSLSNNLTITVAKWAVDVTINFDTNPVIRGENVTIYGTILVPENSSVLANVPLTIWWDNSTHIENLTVVWSSGLGTYSFQYQVPINHLVEIVDVWAEFVSPSVLYGDALSPIALLNVTVYDSYIASFSNSTYYHLNETAYIFGQLTREGGIPLTGQIVYLTWDNGTKTPIYQLTTNSSGWFNFYYNFSLANDDPSTITITFSFTSLNKSIDNATDTLVIISQLYQLTLDADVASNTVHLDEVIQFSGTLIFNQGTKPAVGEMITIYYRNATNTYQYIKYTNSTGGFLFLYNLTLNDALGAVYIWAEYLSSDPLWDNAQSLNRTVNLIRYQFDLSLLSNSTLYHLDEVAHFWGFLTYQHNGTPLSGQPVMIHWNNGTEIIYGPYYTNGSGYFEFFYNCSLNDKVGFIDVWATFNNNNVMWDNATSSTLTISIDRYSFLLTLTTDSSTYYIDEVVHVYGQLTYQVNGSPLAGQPIDIIWNDGSQTTYYGYITNSTGYFNFYYNLTPGADMDVMVLIQAQFINTNPLWNNATSSSTSISITLYSATLSIAPSPLTQYLNETIQITGSLIFQHNSSAIRNANITLWWNFGNGTTINIGWVFTNSSGQFSTTYSGMDEFTILTADIFATWSGNVSFYNTTSPSQTVTLKRWATLFSSFQIETGLNYHPTETLLINASLFYSSGPTPYYNAAVNVYFGGSFIGSNTTLQNGQFILRWVIPENTTLGAYDITLEFVSNVNWISGSTTSPLSISITAYTLVWTIIVDPSPTAYLDDRLNISGYVYLDNGTPYAWASVTLMWDHSTDSEGWIDITTIVTDASGWYQFDFAIPDDTPVSSTDIMAYCAPNKSYIQPGYSGIITISIEYVPVNLESDYTAPSPLYRGDTVHIYGNLTFSLNGSAMVGYVVNLVWNAHVVDSVTIDDVVNGYFEFYYSLNESHVLGANDFYVEVDRTLRQDIEYNMTAIITIDVYDAVELTLDPLDDTTVFRGTSIAISGWAGNSYGFGADIPLVLTLDGVDQFTFTTNTDGSFTVTLDIQSDLNLGGHTISIDIDSTSPNATYYDVIGTPDSLDITVMSTTSLEVSFSNRHDIMPGEAFEVIVRLVDDSGTSILPQSITFYFNSTPLYTTIIYDSSPATLNLPSSWSQRGLFYLTASFDSTTTYNGSSGNTGNTVIHVFLDVYLEPITPSVVAPNQSLVIEGNLYDSADTATRIPIANRLIRIDLNGTRTVEVYTDNTGHFVYRGVSTPRREGTFYFQVTLVSDVSDITLNPTHITISQTGGFTMQLTDIIPFIALAGAVVIVLLYLYFVKGMFQGKVSRPSIDFATKLRNIQKLRDAGKYSAAITLAYRTFEQLCGIKVGAERMHSETAREFLERVSKVLPLDMDVVEKFVQIYEEARFSNHEITREKFDLAIKIFTDIYPRVEESTPLVPTT